MKKMVSHLVVVIIVSFFFTGWACGGGDDGMTSSGPRTTVLISTTFEKDSLFNLSGWVVEEPERSAWVSGTTDTPGPTSKFALAIRRDTVNKVVPGVTTTAIAKYASNSAYTIGLWAKGKGTLLVRQRREDGPHSETFSFNSTVWNYYSLSTFTARPTADTLSFTFRPYDIDPVPYLFIDNVSVTYMKW